MTVGGLRLSLLEVGCNAILRRIMTHLFNVSLIKVWTLLVDEMIQK